MKKSRDAETQQKIRENLAIWKIRNNKKNADFARALGMSRTSLYEKVRGEREWTISEFVPMCELFGVTPNELLGITG